MDAIPELGQNCNEANYPEVTVSEHHKEMFRCPYCDHITVLMFIPELNLYECDNCHVGFDEREAEMMTGEFAKASGRK